MSLELWAPKWRRLTLGILLTISVVGFENLGVATALPVVSDALDGDRLYGWSFSAFLLGQLLGTVLAGTAADRVGLRRPMAVAAVVFAAGLVVCSAAQSMEVLVAGRAITGVGSGAALMLAFAAVGTAFPEELRGRALAVTQAAWIAPALVGPAIAGPVAEHVAWQLVFSGLLPVLVLGALLVIPALADSPAGSPSPVAGTERFWDASSRQRIVAAVVVTIGGAALVHGLAQSSIVRATTFLLIGVAAVGLAGRTLFPPGTWRTRAGMASIVAAYGMLMGVFVGVEALLPKVLDDVREMSAFRGGLFLSIGTISWTIGATMQARRGELFLRPGIRTRAVLVLFVGLVGSGAAVISTLPIGIGLALWLVAGLGMGLTFTAVTEAMYRSAPVERIGAATSATQLAGSLGAAIAAGSSGALRNVADNAGWNVRPQAWLAYAFQVALAILTVIAVSRVKATGDRISEA